MNEFEKAVNIENYTGDTTQECVIEWIRGDKEVTVTFASHTKYNTKVRKLAEQNPEDVKIVAENPDGSIVAHLPLSYIKVNKPKQMNYSEEQKEAMRERLKSARENTQTTNLVNPSYVDSNWLNRLEISKVV